MLVSDHDNCRERKVAAAFDHFGNAVDENDSVDELAETFDVDD
jgi:hypothetical protein